jgi:hypothetical protein
MLFLCIFVALRVVVNYTKPLSVATETPERVPFALSLRYKIFLTAGKQCKGASVFMQVPDIVARL